MARYVRSWASSGRGRFQITYQELLGGSAPPPVRTVTMGLPAVAGSPIETFFRSTAATSGVLGALSTVSSTMVMPAPTQGLSTAAGYTVGDCAPTPAALIA